MVETAVKVPYIEGIEYFFLVLPMRETDDTIGLLVLTMCTVNIL